MRVVTRKGEKGSLRKNSTSTRAMWKFMLKSINYGANDDKIYNPPPSFFGLPLGQFSQDDDQLPTPVEVSDVKFFVVFKFVGVLRCVSLRGKVLL